MSQPLGFPSSSTCLPGWGCRGQRPLRVGSCSGPVTELVTALEYLGSCAEAKLSFRSSKLKQPTLLGS